MLIRLKMVLYLLLYKIANKKIMWKYFKYYEICKANIAFTMTF